jgi:hypothetical protein
VLPHARRRTALAAPGQLTDQHRLMAGSREPRLSSFADGLAT